MSVKSSLSTVQCGVWCCCAVAGADQVQVVICDGVAVPSQVQRDDADIRLEVCGYTGPRQGRLATTNRQTVAITSTHSIQRSPQ